MGALTKYLTNLLPRTGRLITERGTIINQADYIEKAFGGIDIFGQTETVEYTPIMERLPLPNISLQRDKILPIGGNVTVSNGQVVIDGTAELTELYTVEHGRYIPGMLSLCGIGYEIPNPLIGSYEMGYGDSIGNRIGLNVTDGVYSTFVESGGVRYYNKPRSQWLDPLDGNGPSGIVADLSMTTFRMIIGWYGTIPTEFYLMVYDRINGANKILIDRADPPVSGFVIEQPDLPVFASADGGIIKIGGRQFGVLGRYVPDFRITGGYRDISNVGTTFVPSLSFRLKSGANFQGVPIKTQGKTVLSTSNADIGIIMGGVLTGAVFGSIPGIDPTETALEMDVTATAISGGYLSYPDKVGGGQGSTSGGAPDEVSGLHIPKDSIVTLAVKATTGTTDISAVLRMLEEW